MNLIHKKNRPPAIELELVLGIFNYRPDLFYTRKHG